MPTPSIADLLTDFLNNAQMQFGVETMTVCLERSDQKLTVATVGMSDAALPLHLMHLAMALLSNVDPAKIADSTALRESVQALRLACEVEVAQTLAQAGCPGASDRRH